MNLYELTSELKSFYEKIENGEELTEEMENALVLTEQNLQTKAIDYGYVIKSLDAEMEMFDNEIKRLQERRKQLAKTQDMLKDRLTGAMQEFGITEMKGRTIKLSFRKSESVDVYNVDALPEEFKRTKITIEPDKVAIKEALKNGEVVEGATLLIKDNLQIK
jgi:predicted RNase H-like nuclease (RuvC/YqgF family)